MKKKLTLLKFELERKLTDVLARGNAVEILQEILLHKWE